MILKRMVLFAGRNREPELNRKDRFSDTEDSLRQNRNGLTRPPSRPNDTSWQKWEEGGVFLISPWTNAPKQDWEVSYVRFLSVLI